MDNVSFHHGSLLDPVPPGLPGRVDLVLGNVRYASLAYRRASWDGMPRTVEGQDEDGLGLPRRLAATASDLLSSGGWLVAQIAAEQSQAFRSELGASGYVDDEVVAARGGDAVVAARKQAGGARS